MRSSIPKVADFEDFGVDSTSLITLRGPSPHVSDNDAMRIAVIDMLQDGPAMVTVTAAGSFSWYSGGVFVSPDDQNLDHQVTIVGYSAATDSVPEHFILKNSWGTGWGEGGYMRVAPGSALMYYKLEQKRFS